MMRRPVLTALALVLLAGCAPTAEPHGLLGKLWRLEVGPQYERPAVVMPEEFRGQLAPTDAASFADQPWWDVFNDPALQQLLQQALAGSYNLQEAVARIEQARAQVGVAAAQFYPQVGYAGAATRNRVPGGIINPALPEATFNVFLGAFDVAWEIDLWGRVRRTTEVARAQFLGNEDARRGVVMSLVSDVAVGYFQLLALDRQLAIARDSAATYQRTRDLFSERYVGGTDTKISSARAEADLQDSIALVAELQRQITLQENAICALLGTTPGPIERGIPLVEQTTPATPPGLTTDILRRRPDILQAEQAMIGANSAIGVAVANFFPAVGLSALYGAASSKIGNIAKDSASLWNIAANLAGPIFQGGRLLESYHAQRAFWDEAIAQYRATIVQAFREVADGLATEARLAEQRTAKQAQVRALREAVDLSLARYQTGRSNYIEVLDAEEMLYPAERALAQTQRDQLVAVVSLYKALGGGWQTAGDQLARR
jgi:multidrug efflux system outer membrane protein